MPYRGYAEHARAWDSLVGARVRRFGASASGEPLSAIEIGPRDAKRACVVLAGIHALEWIGVEVASALLARLARAPPDALVVAFPMVNVDGFQRVEARRSSGHTRFFTRGNANGVDLNRNWPTFFRAHTLAGTVAPWIWRSGARAGSEPEVSALLAELDALAARTRIARALSIHSYGRAVLYPYGGLWRAPPEELREAAIDLAARLGYRAHQVSRWVPGFSFAHGMEIDHLHAAYGATALLVECSGGGLSARTALDPWRWFNPPDLEAELVNIVPALESFVRAT
jgi:predicted deacylase